MLSRTGRSFTGLATMLAAAACSDTTATSPDARRCRVLRRQILGHRTSIAWNQTARDLIAARDLTNPGVQSRILTYLSVAQNNAIVAAEDTKDRGDHGVPSAAAAGASVLVLKSFFPTRWGADRSWLVAQRASTPWPGEQQKDFAGGEAVGRAIGALVVAYAATDRTGLTPPPANPGGTRSLDWSE